MARSRYCELEPKARLALDFVNRSALPANHLVYNPNCAYGFTDTVAKTGSLLFCSLLYVDVSRQLTSLSARYGCGNASRYASEAATLGGEIDHIMRDPAGGGAVAGCDGRQLLPRRGARRTWWP